MSFDPGPIPPFLDRVKLVHTFTNLNTYDSTCPHQFYRRYIVKDIPYVETDAMRHGNAVHKAMELRIGNKMPLPPEFAHWEPFAEPFDGRNAKCELKLGMTKEGTTCDFFAKDAWLRGKLDAVVVNNEKAYLNDWKTGNSKYEDRFELDVGALLLQAARPQTKVIKGQYTWLKENRPGTVYDLSCTVLTMKKVDDIVRSIERDRASGQFEKRRGPLCAYCDCFDCEHNRKNK